MRYLVFALICMVSMAVNAQKLSYGEFTGRPDKSTNMKELKSQYRKNKKQYDAAFAWLASNDLLAIPAGKHKIGDSGLVASVEDSTNDPLEKRGSESHYHHVDLQYVVKGCERFGLLDHKTSTPKGPWKDDVVNYNYDVAKTRFIDSTPGRFFLFYPSDWHIAKIRTDKEDQTIRVIVIKLDYID